ncbi:hypothetical protein ACFQ5J_05415 [Lacticaseibacillus baoqingensis]|uniref:Transcriptional regulator n=1 Tax=Lacticaseibacillus baoqingensis TaxID=2486013 RepID=A0ABW4E6C0_9LACO|nr:hypothetical protein [Lacticaseibacillus baoqingensis]
MAKHEAIVNGYRELGSLSLVVEKMGYSYSVVQRHVSDARKYGELPKKGKRNDNQ